MLGSCDDRFIGIVVGKVHICLLLNGRIEPPVVDAQSYQVDILTFHAARLDRRVLRFEVASELRPIMSAVRFSEDTFF